MKPTGMIRRVDDLGRVVIPKEIRRTCLINIGDPLEIFIDENKNIIFKRHLPYSEPWRLLEEAVEEMRDNADFNKFVKEVDELAHKIKNFRTF